MPSTLGVALLGGLVLAGLAGCSGADGQARSGSARVEVFVTQPTLTIGSLVEGAGPTLFAGITDAHRLSDGRIVVGDCQSSELRYFDRDGSHLRSVGGPGQGPGEFTWLTRIFPVGGDSIAVYDQWSGRVSIFSGEGDFVRSFSAGGAGRGFVMKGAIGSDRFVGVATDRVQDGEPGTVFRSSQTLVFLDGRGTVTDSVGPLPGSESAVSGPVIGSPRLGRSSRVAVSRAGVAHSAGDAAGPLLLTPALDDSTRVPPLTVAGPTTAEHMQLWEEVSDDRGMAPEGGVIPVYSDLYADSLPVHGDMYLDDDGGLWLQDPELPWDHPLMYTRYVDGRAELRVELPPRFFPLELDPDGILGVTFDANDIERIQLLNLVRGDTQTVARTPREIAPPLVPRCGFWVSR